MPVIINGAHNKPQNLQDNRVDRVYHKATLLEPRLITEPKVIGISDWKGHLFVLWRTKPTCAEMAAFEKAWESECEYQISHWIRDNLARDQFAEIEIGFNVDSPFGSSQLHEMYRHEIEAQGDNK